MNRTGRDKLDMFILLLALLASRLLFLAFHWNSLDLLWSDYERHGLRYRFALILDIVTSLIFLLFTLRFIYLFSTYTYPLMEAFVATGGLALLNRLQVHRFPRTNSPSAFNEAKTDLLVHMIMSLITAVVFTLATAIYIWFRAP